MMNHSSRLRMSLRLVALALLAPMAAEAGLLDRDATKALISGATAKHWYLGNQRWFEFKWLEDGKVTVHNPGAAADAKPFDAGKWRIKEVKREEGMTDAEFKRRNAELDHVYCHRFERLWSGNEICWELHQVSFDKDESGEPLPTQTYKVYRGQGAETGEFVIKSRSAVK